MKKWIFAVVMAIAMISLGLNGLILRNETVLEQRVEMAETNLNSAKKELEEKIGNETLKRKTESEELRKEMNDEILANMRALDKKSEELRKEMNDEILANMRALDKKSEKELARVESRIIDLFNPAQIYDGVKKSVVTILAKDEVGTGFLFEKKNQLITAYHAIKSPPGTKVFLIDNETASLKTGKIKKNNPEWDLTVIELDEPIDAEPLMPGDTKNLAIGTSVLVIGSPYGAKNSASTGVISGFGRRVLNLPQVRLIQTDASVYYGNSGGPMLDKNGKVIGVMSRALMGSFSFAFAIPIDNVIRLVNE